MQATRINPAITARYIAAMRESGQWINPPEELIELWDGFSAADLLAVVAYLQALAG